MMNKTQPLIGLSGDSGNMLEWTQIVCEGNSQVLYHLIKIVEIDCLVGRKTHVDDDTLWGMEHHSPQLIL